MQVALLNPEKLRPKFWKKIDSNFNRRHNRSHCNDDLQRQSVELYKLTFDCSATCC